jgi:nucleoside-diphosphate-sugar epimerase
LNILFSGGSSFTGYWFVEELRRRGHQVVCTFRGSSLESYSDLRGWRVSQLCRQGPAAFGYTFGSEPFLELLNSQRWDVYGHHAADVANYRSLDFDAVAALANNTHNLRRVLATLKDGGCRKVVLTGSVFEGGEGAGSDGLPHILPYGLSKALTSEVFAYEAALAGLALGKFVIPNPFGPYQEPRFLQYLMSTWRNGQVAKVSTPAYVRDNIHVQLLAKDYRHFLESLGDQPGLQRRNPSGIVSDQGSFAHLVAREMRARLGWDCGLELATQTEFAEPLVRINTDSAALRHPNWDETAAWDRLAEPRAQPASPLCPP